MTRTSTNEIIEKGEVSHIYNGFSYNMQTWILKGIVQNCGHPPAMQCGCYGRKHAGEAWEGGTQ